MAVIIRLMVILICYLPLTSWGWGGRGHAHICEAASYLVDQPELKLFLQSRAYLMAHLCNIPDTYWKSLSGDARSLGDPTHYIDPEVLGVSFEQIPLSSFKTLEKKYFKKSNLFKKENPPILSLASEFGSLFWRVEQLFNLGSSQFKLASQSPPPTQKSEEQNTQLPFNQAVYEGLMTLGVMGHFIGDGVQPYHLTADYDGYQSGHGGIHAFYEEEAVNQLPGDWTAQVLTQAELLKKDWTNSAKSPLKEKSTLAKVKAVTQLSYQELSAVTQLDPLIEASSEQDHKGLIIKKPAIRKSVTQVLPQWTPYLKNQMARGALLLAHLWDQAYLQKNKKNWPLAKYKNYQHPFTVPFIKPDYHH